MGKRLFSVGGWKPWFLALIVALGCAFAQGKAGKSASRPLKLILDDLIKVYRAFDSTLSLRFSTWQGMGVPIHFDEFYFDPNSVSGPRTWAVDVPTWSYGVNYAFRPVRPVYMNFGFSSSPMQFNNMFNGFNESYNFSLTTSWDIGADMNVTLQLYDNNTYGAASARSSTGDLYTLTENDFAGLTSGTYFRKYNRLFLEWKPLKTLNPVEPRFSLNWEQQNVTFPNYALDNVDRNNTGSATSVETLNLLTLSGSIILRLDQGVTAYAGYSQTPYNNTRNSAGGVQNYLSQNWSTWVDLRLNRYMSMRVSLSYGRSLNRGDSIYRTAAWSSAWEELNDATKTFSTYFGERNGDSTSFSVSMNLR
jgi:hypothetical protein